MLRWLRRWFKRFQQAAFGERAFSVVFEKSSDGWLAANLPARLRAPRTTDGGKIEAAARLTNDEGPRPLWEGYARVLNYPFSRTGERMPDAVRTVETMGRIFAWLVRARKPDAVIEIGTAFGVSGMYWLSGLESAGHGRLYTFEPNAEWADRAEKNLAAISDMFTLVRGPFETSAEAIGDVRADIAFIDAIHTRDFVRLQYESLKKFMSPGGLILFDDINFSDDMRQCWQEMAHLPEVRASVRLGDRVGIIELGARRSDPTA